MKMLYLRLKWMLGRRILNALLIQYMDDPHFDEIKVHEPDYYKKLVLIDFTENSKHIISSLPGGITGFTIQGNMKPIVNYGQK